MKKVLIETSQINEISAYDGIEAVILMTEAGEIYVDLVLAESDIFWRLCKAPRHGRPEREQRSFKMVSTAVNLLIDEGFPEIKIKQSRRDLCAPNLHTKE